MIYFDTTKAARGSHRSGLMRVTTRLVADLGANAVAVRWPERPAQLGANDWYVTGELFSESERPGFSAFLDHPGCHTAAIFHDAIPLKLPHITWPQSVARHPAYLKLLAKFERVFAVSAASKTELEGIWRWQGLERTPSVDVLHLGADFNGDPRRASTSSGVGRQLAAVGNSAATEPPSDGSKLPTYDRRTSGMPLLLCVGILEPRKNQRFLLDVCETLWGRGMAFDLHVVGRVNPHFGKPIVAHLRQLARAYPQRLTWHDSPDDATVAALYQRARATVFPTIAEGCGLPLLESLWMGVPCVCSDLPVLRENADAGGCFPVAVNDTAAWTSALEHVLTDQALVEKLAAEAASRPLPTWADTAQQLRAALASRR